MSSALRYSGREPTTAASQSITPRAATTIAAVRAHAAATRTATGTARRVCRDREARWVLWDLAAPSANRASRDRRAKGVLREDRDRRGRGVPKANKVRGDRQAREVLWASAACRAKRVNRVRWGREARRDRKARLVSKDR